MVTDTIGDAVARINNALLRDRDSVVLPKSRLLGEVLRVIQTNSFIGNIETNENEFVVSLRGEGVNRITNIKRISKPGLRAYSTYKELERVLNGYGISVVSTSKGVLSDKEARKQKTGGEVILQVY